MTRYYRKADKLKQERKNQELWLQGMYIYEALCDASPLFQSFAKRGTKAHPYRDMPYPLTAEDKEHNEEVHAKNKQEDIKAKMLAFMKRHNEKLTDPPPDKGGDNP